MEQVAVESSTGSRSSEASSSSELAVPDEYVCPITAEIMTDPVVTVRAASLLLLYTEPRAHTLAASMAGGRLHLRAHCYIDVV